MRKTPVLTALLAAVLAGAIGAAAAEEPPVAEGAEADAAIDTAEVAERYRPTTVLGVQVWIDAETGQLRPPTAEESAQLAAELQQRFATPSLARRAAPAPQVRFHKSGMRSLQLDSAALEFSVVRIDDDGDVVLDCVDSLDEATEASVSPVSQREDR